jgi:hypothetical protein
LALLALAATTYGDASATPNANTTAHTLVGAWAPKGARCRDGQFVTVYLADGRVYSGLTDRGPSIGGRYEVVGNVLTERVRTEPAFRTGSPAMAPYETRFLTERRTLEKVSRGRIELGFPGNRNPDLTTPSIARCPEQPGVEPWFPRERYGGFAPMRKLLPKAQ